MLAGKYRLERHLGSGGFASVWAARNIEIDRPVALKILSENLAADPDVVARFVREATIAARQIHATILRVEDIARTSAGIPFLVMELLDGHTLSTEIKARGALPIAECIEIARLTLEGLAAAHACDIIHRDIKPSNLFLTSPTAVGPRVRILDLGLAKDLAAGAGVTNSEQWMGTPDYLPPELFLDEQWRELGPTGDVFAFGVAFFEMLTGRRPLDGRVPRGSSPSMLFKRIAYYKANPELPRPVDLVQGVPIELDAVVRRALSVDPSKRYPDAGAMLAALDRAVELMLTRVPSLEALPRAPALPRSASLDTSEPAPFVEHATPSSRSGGSPGARRDPSLSSAGSGRARAAARAGAGGGENPFEFMPTRERRLDELQDNSPTTVNLGGTSREGEIEELSARDLVFDAASSPGSVKWLVGPGAAVARSPSTDPPGPGSSIGIMRPIEPVPGLLEPVAGPGRQRRWLLGLVLGAMALSLASLAVILLMTRGPEAAQPGLSSPVPRLPDAGPAPVEPATPPLATDAGRTDADSIASDAAAARADAGPGGVRVEPDAGPAPAKPPRKRPVIRRGGGGGDEAPPESIPFDELGRGGGR